MCLPIHIFLMKIRFYFFPSLLLNKIKFHRVSGSKPSISIQTSLLHSLICASMLQVENGIFFILWDSQKDLEQLSYYKCQLLFSNYYNKKVILLNYLNKMSEQQHVHSHECTHHDEKHHHHKEQKFTNEKSLVVFDVKPTSQGTDLHKIKHEITQNIHQDGLFWGESKFQQIAYGLKKLVIGAVVKDKVSVEDLVEKIKKIDGVQDVDIASFNEV